MIDLATAIDQTFTAVYTRIKDAAKSDAELSKLRAVVRGDRTNTHPQTPALWVMMGQARATHNASFREEWVVEFHLVAVVNMANDNAAFMAATLANRASSVLLRDRRLGLPQIVQDVKRQTIFTQPARGPDETSGLYAVDVQTNVTIQIREQECGA